MLRLAVAREGLDDDHAATAAWTWTRQHAGFIDRCFGCLGLFLGRRHGEQLAGVRDVGGTVGAGEQAVMANAMEAFWQYVDEEAANELGRIERHGLVAAGPFDPIVFVLEADTVVVERDQSAVSDSDAVGVSRQVSEHGLRPAERQEPSEALQAKTSRLKEKIETLKQQMRRLQGLKVEMLATPDQQISLVDPDARSMATSGRGSGVVGYNVQVAVDTEHHLIVMHEVTNDGTDRSQLSHVANETKAVLGVDKLDAVADRGYFSSEEIRACEEAGITVTLPKPMTSNAKAEGRFGKQDFRYVADEDVYVCPAGEKLTYRYTTEENGLMLRRYWTNACQSCAIKPTCTTAKERRITRWEHEEILEAVQRRLDEHPEKMRQRRETVEHPFGTIKARMGATHFLMKTLPKVATEMALHVLAYNLTRVMNIMGIQPFMAAMRA